MEVTGSSPVSPTRKAGNVIMNLEILTNESKERLQKAILAHMKIGFVLMGPVQVGLSLEGVIYVATLLRESAEIS